jgi:hypothetical protein
MAVGEHITSVYPGSADPACFDVYPPASHRQTRKVAWGEQDHREFELYRQVRNLREAGSVDEKNLSELLEAVRSGAPGSWLLWLELLELAPAGGRLAAELRDGLEKLAQSDPELRQLIERGVKLVDNAEEPVNLSVGAA